VPQGDPKQGTGIFIEKDFKKMFPLGRQLQSIVKKNPPTNGKRRQPFCGFQKNESV
jgi:hypothetical protein